MYIAKPKRTYKGKEYTSVLLRESYREGGKVKNRTIASLSACKPEDIAAIEFALKHKDDIDRLQRLDGVVLEEGLSVGAVWVVYEMARRLGIVAALGNSRAGKLALWQVIVRVLDQGSRLSAVRLARLHAGCDILGIRKGFNEDTLYENLGWLAEHQESIEKKLFAKRHADGPPSLFLYDVTSSYLEGDGNELGAYGYNRDGKEGKKQIVVGLLCDDEGEPVSTQVFSGNTQDPATFGEQVRKTSALFGCKQVTFVGDRGMIKQAQIDQLASQGFHYISAITKPQIGTLLQRGVLQMSLFDEKVLEVEEAGIRYILRRNPVRVEALRANRAEKQERIAAYVAQRNAYLAAHARASVEVVMSHVRRRIEKRRIDGWLTVTSEGRSLQLVVDESALADAAALDGCYVLKTDLPSPAASAQKVHDRYKDLALVEHAFRTCKTGHLEIRPLYVRKEASTRGHVLVVMLSYMIIRELHRLWAGLNLTVQEGLAHLTTLCSIRMVSGGVQRLQTIPVPRQLSADLLAAADVRLPSVLPTHNVNVVTKKKISRSN